MEKKITSVLVEKNKEISFETGHVAKQSSGSVILRYNDNVIFSSACSSNKVNEDPNADPSFLPLRVDHQEKFSSVGKTLNGFIKREGRPSEREILISRLVDRSLRPVMVEGFFQETQILSYVWSYDGSSLPEPLAICAASAALLISDIPVSKPVAGVQVGLINDTFVINPSLEELKKSCLDLVLSGTENAILMIEGHSNFLTEEKLLEAISFGHEKIKLICSALSKWQKEVGKEKNLSLIKHIPEIVINQVKENSEEQLQKIFSISDKQIRETKLSDFESSLLEQLASKEDVSFSPFNVKAAYKKIKAQSMRKIVLETKKRLDNRNFDDIRNISIDMHFLPRPHGSSLFTRGETQTLAVCTLGGEGMTQKFEDLNGEGNHKFYFQYFFPPFSVGEVGRLGIGRREVGHGKLAEKALQRILPSFLDFPYTIRLESNITESNGSSSMASVCGGCLALMDAGVPIKNPVSGIAMGLILENNETIILSDILGIEDALGDMDFKIAGNEEGITAFQMDIKIEGITIDIMKKAFNQAKEGRNLILKEMLKTMPTFNKEVSCYAPRIETIKIKQNKISTVIGPGGKQIKQIIEKTGVQIDINDSGLINITTSNQDAMNKAKEMIERLVGEVEVGKIYKGKVVSIVNFGAFIEVLPGKEGLCHISELSNERVAQVSDVLKEGDMVDVKVTNVNEKGQIKLSIKEIKSSL